MPIPVACACGKKFVAKDEFAGKKAKCPACGQVLTIGVAPASAPVDPLDLGTPLAAAPPTETRKLPKMASQARPRPRTASKGGWFGFPRGWLIGIGAGAAGILAVVVVLLLVFGGSKEQAATAGPTVASGNPAPPTTPSLTPTTAPSAIPAAPGAAMPDPKTLAATPPSTWPRAMAQLPDWLLQDSAFDVRQFWITVPPEENAAPLYLDALYEFSPSMEVGFAPDIRVQHTAAVKARLERYTNLERQWYAPNQPTRNPAERDAILREYEVGFQKLAAAQQRNRCVFELGLDYAGHVPLAHAARTVAWVARLQAGQDLERGDLEAVLRMIDILLRCSRDLRHRAASDMQGWSNGLEAMCLEDVVKPLLDSPAFKPAHCDQLLTSLTRHDGEVKTIDPLLTGLRGDYLFLRVLLHDLQGRTGEFDAARFRQAFGATNETLGEAVLSASSDTLGVLKVPDRKLMVGKPLDPLLAAMNAENFVSEAAWLTEWYKLQASTISQPRAAREQAERSLYGAFFAAMPRDMPPDQALAKLQEVVAKRTTAIFAPILQMTGSQRLGLYPPRQGDVESRTSFQGYWALAALRRWHFAHSEPPPDIAALFVGSSEAELPRDYWGEGPLRLKTFREETTIISRRSGGDFKMMPGETLVYSVGSDGKDDQAVKDWSAPGGGGDVIFHLGAAVAKSPSR